MKATSLYTKTGFSKQGFSCCSRFSFCNMGVDDCYYDGIDNEVKNHCNCYKRNHVKKTVSTNYYDNQEDSRKSFYEFNDSEVLLVMGCFNSNCIQMGDRYLLKEKNFYKSFTQANVYTTSNEFIGVQSINDFSVIESLTEEKFVEIIEDSKKKEVNDDYFTGGEQLSLF
ncbi:hypothetical protein [Anaerobacillus sp. 1_MG-2023]|uniref:hypothetical protein n=1 Tax=Anaerobacillus sp. 1_MG-2023 TaxID=3062655 RepID=UPI0026E2925A|nr:hypothetical protein [Anaerobacillus sp. 1_MG-2023]MDO6657499.1 hypothetical protein [Anaerobacillus sp. 1_MG-2023]